MIQPIWIMIMWSGDGGHKGGLLDIDPGLMIWTVITFFLLLVLLGKFAWKPIIKTLQEREERIKDSLEEADRARREADALIAKNNEILARAEREAQDVVRKAKEEAEKLKVSYQIQARAETDKMLENARKEIQSEKNAAVVQLKKEMADIVVTAAGKVIGSALDADKHRKVIDDYIKDIPVSRN